MARTATGGGGGGSVDYVATIQLNGDASGLQREGERAKQTMADVEGAFARVGQRGEVLGRQLQQTGSAFNDKARQAAAAATTLNTVADTAGKTSLVVDKLRPKMVDLGKQFGTAALSSGNFLSSILSLGGAFGPYGVAVATAASALVGYINKTKEAEETTRRLRLEIEERRKAKIDEQDQAIMQELSASVAAAKAEAGRRSRGGDQRDEELRALEEVMAQHGEQSALRTRMVELQAEQLRADADQLRSTRDLADATKNVGLEEKLQTLELQAQSLERENHLRLLRERGEAERAARSSGGGRVQGPSDPFAEQRAEFAFQLDEARRAKFQQQREEDFIFGTREEQIAREALDEQERIQRLRRREDAERAAHEAKMDRARREKAAENEAAQRRKAHTAEAVSHTQHGVAGLVSIADARRKARVAALAQGATEAQAAEAGRAAALRQTASVLTAIRDRSIVKAIEHTAEGVGALARYDYGSAALHFTSAGIFGGIAGTTAGLAVATENRANSLDRRSGGGALGGGGSGGSGGSGGFGGGGGGGSIPSVPASPEIAFGASRGNTAPTIIFNGPINGSVDKEFVRQITEKQDQLRHERRRTV